MDVFEAVAELRHHGQLIDQSQAHRQGSAPGVDHRIGEHHGAGGGAGHDRTPGPGLPERLEGGGAFEHGLEVEGGSAGEVHEAGAPDHRGHAGVVGRGPIDHHQALDLAAQGGEPFGGVQRHALGVLVGGGRRQHHHFLAA